MKCENCKSKITRKGCGVCKDNPYLCDNWEKEEPKVLTVEELWNENFQADLQFTLFKKTHKKIHQNGRLERDLEYKKAFKDGLIEFGKKNGISLSAELILFIKKNLKSLET